MTIREAIKEGWAEQCPVKVAAMADKLRSLGCNYNQVEDCFAHALNRPVE